MLDQTERNVQPSLRQFAMHLPDCSAPQCLGTTIVASPVRGLAHFNYPPATVTLHLRGSRHLESNSWTGSVIVIGTDISDEIPKACGPLANSLFHDRPDEAFKPSASKVETACHKADHAIEHALDLLAA
jgi:hypothetical protein